MPRMTNEKAFQSGIRSFQMGQHVSSCYLKQDEHRKHWKNGWHHAKQNMPEQEQRLNRALKGVRQCICRHGKAHVFVTKRGTIHVRSEMPPEKMQRYENLGYELAGFYQAGVATLDVRDDIELTIKELNEC